MQPTAEQLREKEMKMNKQKEKKEKRINFQIKNHQRSVCRREWLVAQEHEEHLKMILRHDLSPLTFAEDNLVRSRAELYAWTNYGRPPTLGELKTAFAEQRSERFQQELEFWMKFVENKDKKLKIFRAEILDEANIFTEDKRKAWDECQEDPEFIRCRLEWEAEERKKNKKNPESPPDSDDDDDDDDSSGDDEKEEEVVLTPAPEDEDEEEDDPEEYPYQPSPTATPDPPPSQPSTTSQLLAPMGSSQQPAKKRPLLEITLPPSLHTDDDEDLPFSFSFPDSQFNTPMVTPDPNPPKKKKSCTDSLNELIESLKEGAISTIDDFGKSENSVPLALHFTVHLETTSEK